MGAHTLKGLSSAIQVFRVVAPSTIETRFEATRDQATLSPLIGRKVELRKLLGRWQAASRGDGNVVLLSGEPGIGKSRLAETLRQRLTGEPHMSMRFQCSPYHTSSALYPIITHIERAAGFAPEDTSEQKLDKMRALLAGSKRQIAEVTPLFAALLSLPTEHYAPVQHPARKEKERTLDALAGQVEALARRRPLLMIFEDAHWIDPTSQEALDLLVSRLQHLPVLLIITHRPEYVASWTGSARVAALELSRLAPAHAKQLVTHLTARKPLPSEVREQIVARTDGVPLFIEEVTGAVLEPRLLQEGNPPRTKQASALTAGIPVTLRDSLVARLHGSPSERETVQIGACIGREFSPRLLAAVSPLQPAALNAALHQLTRAGLLLRHGAEPTATFAFKHELVRDAAYDLLLKSKRLELHARVARALEAQFPEIVDTKPELLARHYSEGGLAESAVSYWLKAAKRAVSKSAYREALAHVSEGREQLQRLSSGHQQALMELQLQLQRGIALQALRGMSAEETGAAFAAAKELSYQLGEDNRQIFPALFGTYIFHIARGEYGSSLDVARQALQRAQRADDAALLVLAHRMMGSPLHYRGEFAEAIYHLERVLFLYDPDRDRESAVTYGSDSKAATLSILAQTLFALGSPDRALSVAAEALSHAEATSHAHSIAHTLAQLAGVCLLRREPNAALEHAQRALLLSEKTGLSMQYEVAKALRGAALIDLGEPSQGMALIRESLQEGEHIGVRIAQASKLRRLAAAAMAMGQWEEAARYMDEALQEVERSGERWYAAELHRCKAEFLLARDGAAATAPAEACFLDGLKIARSQAARGWELRISVGLARIWRDQTRIEDARELLLPIYGSFTEGFDTKDLQEARALLSELG
jgi:predicted ATPase